MSARQMKLGAFLWATGHHIAAWRHPDAHVTAGIDIDHYIQLARTAEAAKLDMIFCEDAAGLREANVQIASQTSRSIGFEPISLLSAIAVQTERIGLVSTASTSYNEPYGLARTFASLDHLSGGRAGWNLVTSASHIEAANFGSTGLRPHADRYERAREFAQVVAGLWRGGGNGGLNHDGHSFSVRDALDLPRSPQGAPVMVQAGASEDGKDLAAMTADVVFSAAQTFEEAKAFYDDVKRRLAAYGREPEDVKIMPGVAPVVAATEAEARQKHEELQELIPDEVGVALLASYLSIADLWRYPIDGPLPELPESEGMKSRQALVVEQSRRDGLSIRQLARHFAGARGHWRIVGTPAQIADE
ncbi:LLM class flavin-dependent oxidoreductase, partial [Mesorhizobium sp. M4B.F.Ca.ET.089.01.1.1]|uniref:LLM class flavin-dependent oxidoreductase n=1 Tax=Mesorhizobium sp. M4B.F.Ca.ET.089.01.1.1 TaxID=2496662 RepID=UPI000FE2C19D